MENSILYIQRLTQLLQLEYEHDKEEYRLQSEKMGLQRKINRGICWYPIDLGRSYYNSLNQLVVEILRRPTPTDDDDIEPLFEYGRPVQFFTQPRPSTFISLQPEPADQASDSTYYSHFASTVSFVDGSRMVVTLPDSHALLELQSQPELGIQLYFDETSYKTMFAALNDVAKAKGNRLAYLRDLFAGQTNPQRRTSMPMRFPWLNATQEEAVNNVLWAKDVEVVHGPPGTGKTTTLVEAIYETLRRETQVLVCAQSNMAVDWISEKLVDRGIPVLRIGNPSRVNDKMLSFTYERKFESHPSYTELWSIRKAIRQLQANRKRGDNTHQKISRLRDRASEIEMTINADLFGEARVVASTLVGSANKLLYRQRYTTVFIDEAAQALEPACWIAIRRASRVILAGDHQQLPPTIKSYEALRQGLGRTLMERIVHNLPTAVTLLRVQYRMNDAIMHFSSQWFYHGQVQADPSVRHRSVLDLDTPILWIDGNEQAQQAATATQTDTDQKAATTSTEALAPANLPDYSETYVGENHGRINKAEASLVLTTLQNYIAKIGLQRFLDERLDIGIISPYKVQTRYLRQLIRQTDTFRPLRDTITVNTVDGFQGQERDIILISLVRSNEQGEIGFLSDLRRMNVAMTRARMKLIIFGDKKTMSHHPFYAKLISYIEKQQEEPTFYTIK